MTSLTTLDRRSQPSRALGFSRAGVVAALAIPLPVLEIRAPAIALELEKSPSTLLVALALAALTGGVVGYLYRNRSLAAGPRVAALSGLIWLAQLATDATGPRFVGIALGLTATTAALILHVTSDRGTSHNRVPDHIAAGGGLALALGYLAISSSRDWIPLLALAGAASIVSAAGLATLDRRRVAAHHRPLIEVSLGGLPIYPSLANFLIAASFGLTWGALPAMNRLTLQRFTSTEPTASMSVLLGGLVGCGLVWTIDRPSGWTREWRGTLAIATGAAMVLAAMAPFRAWTLGWWIIALGCGAALLITQLNLPTTGSSSREVAASGGVGIVVGLCCSAITLSTVSIDARLVVVALGVPVLLLGVAQRRQITVL